MNLNDFDKRRLASKALKENFAVQFDPSKLDKIKTQTMLMKVRKSLGEAKTSKNFYEAQRSESYLKLLFMEQALKEHYNKLLSQKTRIVFENEEVEKSQVILAAQDMVDSVQKMLEDVGEMQVKELPALVSSIESEMDANKAQEFNTQVSQQLDTLSESLKAGFDGIKAALNQLTGVGGGVAQAFDTGAELGAAAGAEAGLDAGLEAGAEMGAEMPPVEEPEPAPVGGVGRAKR
jgi:hypothetical protein